MNETYFEDEEFIDFENTIDDDTLVMGCGKMGATDAFIMSMNDKARVDLRYMESISGLDADSLIDALSGKTIVPDPELYEKNEDYLECFMAKEAYLSGNLIRKYKAANRINEKYGLFEETLMLLRNSIPDYVDPDDIHMNLASTWIPEKYKSVFVQRLLGMNVPPCISYDEFLGKCNITITIASNPNYVKNNYEFGTLRMPALSIIRRILNAKPVKVYDQIVNIEGKTESILNKEETLAAQQKEKIIQEEWEKFVHSDSIIEKKLQETYMECYGYNRCKYDGSYLMLTDMNKNITLYPHQKDAVARILLNNNTLLAHEVGAGKSYEYDIGVHELLRLKLGNKALIVVPNNTFQQSVDSYKELYPQDKILAVYPKRDFKPSNRTETISKMRSNEYQVIFLAYSSFDKLSLSYKYCLRKLKKQIDECKMHISNATNITNRLALEAELKKLEKKMKKYRESEECHGETACFDQLGIDILVVDEAHSYKNITLDNQTEDIIGVHSSGAKKANNMLSIVDYLQTIDGRVIFATGTPITNSLADVYVLQRYLQPHELKICKVFHFNDWVSTFCSKSYSFEIDVDSKNFRFTTKFSKFHNLPELMNLFSNICDFYKIGNGDLALPNFDGYTNVVVYKSEDQREFINQLAERTEEIRTHKVNRKQDNLLLITVDGRKCALDIRLLFPNIAIDHATTKVAECAKRIASIYYDYPRTTQIAFSDIGTPKDGFNIYDELRSILVNEYAIPNNEIKYIHEAETESQRNSLEKEFNNGTVRILIGTTTKLGTGTNVQERLIAVHHLDVPWRPADMVQREGRLIRQGNMNKKVDVYRYITEASFDAYSWQILENKQRFISEFLEGSLSTMHREESDCAETVLDYAEIKALAIGNPLIRSRVELSNKLEHVKINQRQKRKELENLRELLESIPKKIEIRKTLIVNAKADSWFYKTKKQSVTKEDRKAFGEELIYALENNTYKEHERLFDSYQGFDVVLPKHMAKENPYIIIRKEDKNTYKISMDDAKPLGCSKRIDYFLEHLDDTVKEYEDILNDLKIQKDNAEYTIGEGNMYDKEVVMLKNELDRIDEKLKEAST